MTDHEIDAEHRALIKAQIALELEHAALEPGDKAAIRLHRMRLRSHAQRLEAHIRRLKETHVTTRIRNY